MHAVVVLGRQVNGREFSTHERAGAFTVATEQFERAEALALGLEYPAVLDLAQLAYGSVGRAEDRARGGVEWTCAFFQGAGEERIEVLEGGRVFDLRLAHVDLVALGEPGDQAILDPGGAALGCAADQA